MSGDQSNIKSQTLEPTQETHSVGDERVAWASHEKQNKFIAIKIVWAEIKLSGPVLVTRGLHGPLMKINSK